MVASHRSPPQGASLDTVRYYLALYLIVFWPGAFLSWFSIHPFIRFWRRLGIRTTLAVHYVLVLVLAVLVFRQRHALLAVDFGTRPPLVAAGIVALSLAIFFRLRISKQLTTQVLTGLPEIEPTRADNRLLTAGVYARVRHPRYLQALLAVLAIALLTNFLATWILAGLSVLVVALIVPFEERELRQRFGEAYDRYCVAVPRFLPRLRRR